MCSSADTLARFVQFKRTASDQRHFKHLSKDVFTLVSADNLDFMHSFARVFCGHQTSSWHGTTVQVAQPLPSLSLAENDKMAEGCIASTSADNTLCAITRGDTVSLTDTEVGAPTRGETVSLTDTAVGAPTRGDTVSLTDTAVESDELLVVALEEEVQSSGNSYLNEDEEDEFAEFVFAATCATDSETNISMDHQDD